MLNMFNDSPGITLLSELRNNLLLNDITVISYSTHKSGRRTIFYYFHKYMSYRHLWKNLEIEFSEITRKQKMGKYGNN